MLNTLRDKIHLNFQTLAIAVILLAGAFYFSYLIYYIINWVNYPYEIEYGEGMLAINYNLWSHNQWHWDFNQVPHVTLLYGLGIPYLVTPFIHWFGESLTILRTYSTICTLLTALIAFLLVKDITKKWYAGVLASVLIISHPIVRGWAILARVDMLNIMFSLLGLYAFYKLKKTKWIYLSCIFFLFAIMIKIASFQALLAVLLYLLITDRKALLKYGLVMFSLIAIYIGIGSLLTNGGLFQHLFSYNQRSPFWWETTAFIINSYRTALLPMLIIIPICILAVFRAFKEKRINIAICYFLIAFPFCLLTSVHKGGWVNYFLDLIIASSLLAAIEINYYLSIIKEHGWRHELSRIPTLIINTMLIWLILMNLAPIYVLPKDSYAEVNQEIAVIIQNDTAPVLSEHAWMVIKAGKTPYSEPFMTTELAKQGKWDDQMQLDQINTKYFQHIILRNSIEDQKPEDIYRWEPEMITAIKNNYHLIYYYKDDQKGQSWYNTAVYEPNK